MILFIKGIFFDQSNRISKMLAGLSSPDINHKIDPVFLQKTIDMLNDLSADIQALLNSGDLDIDALSANNIIKYNTFHERLLSIELFRYLVIINYGEAEEYFKKKVIRIYNEVNCLQKPPLITTISNSENYYWALPTYDIIAVPAGEEKNLLNLPDLYHEKGHLIYNQYSDFLKGNIEATIRHFYQEEIQSVVNLQRPAALISFYRDKLTRWINGWIMEFTCDLIATYLVGPAYAWTNLKLTTLSSGKDWIYEDSPSHPSDEARMRAIFQMLKVQGHTTEVAQIEKSWGEFLVVTNNPIPQNYRFIFPQSILDELVKNVLAGCKSIDLRCYNDQITKFGTPISKILNDAWNELFTNPINFLAWEAEKIKEIRASL
jgi:hypothetical protein